GLPASSLFVDPIAKAIANRFIAINYHKSASDSGKQRYQLTNRQMERVRDFVEANLDSDIRLEMMARVCGRSTEYFVRIFKATAGVSPYQYVLNLRIERAKALLGRDGPGIANADAKGVSNATPLSTFVYNSLQYRVVFGFGTVARLGDEAERLGIKRALVLTTHQQREEGARLGTRLGRRFAGIFSDATMH